MAPFIASKFAIFASFLKVYKLVEEIKAKGGTVTREPGPVKGGSTVIAFVKDPDGYLFEILQRASTPEPLCQVMLRVGDLERSIKFYEKVTFSYLYLLFMDILVYILDFPNANLYRNFQLNCEEKENACHFCGHIHLSQF